MPSPAKDPARNVWLQLGLPDDEEHYVKAELVLRPADWPQPIRQTSRTHRTIKALKLTQQAAAKRIGASQSELWRGVMWSYTIGRGG